VFTIIIVSCITNGLCCNPFSESGYNNVRNNLRIIVPWMAEELPHLNSDHKICDKCHKKVSKLKYDVSSKRKGDD
jgi:hypothetical protein